MKIKTYFVLTTISCLLFGGGFLALPGQVAKLHNVLVLEDFTIMVMRLYGGALVATGLMGWFTRDAGPGIARKAILLFLLVFDIFNSLINLQFIVDNGGNFMNWIELVVTILFGIGACYFWTKEVI